MESDINEYTRKIITNTGNSSWAFDVSPGYNTGIDSKKEKASRQEYESITFKEKHECLRFTKIGSPV